MQPRRWPRARRERSTRRKFCVRPRRSRQRARRDLLQQAAGSQLHHVLRLDRRAGEHVAFPLAVRADRPAELRRHPRGGLGELIGELVERVRHDRVENRERAGHRFTGVGIFLRLVATPVLHVHDLVLGPAFLKLAEDAAVVAGVAIAVVLAFPRNDRDEVRRLESRHLPLVHRVVGDARHRDLAVGPRLDGRPLDRLVDVRQRFVLAVLGEPLGQFRAPALRQFLERGDVEVAVEEERLQLRRHLRG